jgi:hypothetical protein
VVSARASFCGVNDRGRARGARRSGVPANVERGDDARVVDVGRASPARYAGRIVERCASGLQEQSERQLVLQQAPVR